MSRIVNLPRGLPIRRYEPLSGPRAIGGGSTESLEGYVQTSASLFGLWRFRFTIGPIRGDVFRAYRGFVTAMHGGANATLIRIIDYDKMSYAAMGANVSESAIKNGVRWAGDIYWKHKKTWELGSPYLENPTPASRGDTTVFLPSQWWGSRLNVGDWFGYAPDHLGLYVVTQIHDDGSYRIWPPLRRDVIADDLATLDPVMAMRLEGSESANLGRDISFSDELTLTMVEVEDADVRDYFL